MAASSITMPARRTHTPRAIHVALLAACMAAIAWGALAFGAVYPWAYTPLAAFCGIFGLVALIVERRGRPAFRGLAISLLVTAVAIGLQLVPLPRPVLMRVSPGTDAFLSQYDLSYQLAESADGSDSMSLRATRQGHPVSIAPGKTAVGAGLFATLALFVLGTSRLASVLTVKRISRGLIAFGGALALIGIVQRGLTAGELQPLIYGFWRPQFESVPFGPFVNPNHFAGWMLMMLPLALAAFLDLVLQMVEASPEEGGRLSALTSPHIGTALFLGIACLVMGLSLLMTRSRSALAAFALGSVMAGWIVFRRQARGKARVAVAGSALVLFLATVAWAGLDTIVTKFTEPQGQKSFVARMGAWRDTVSIIRDFPLTGAGLDTYGTAMTLYQTGSRERHFQEAHNDYLQLAAEGGLLVGIPVLVTIGFFIRDVRRRFREAPKHGTTYCLRVGAVVGLISVALQSFAEFSLQMPGNAALFALLAGIAIHQSPNLTGISSRAAGRARVDPPYVRT